MYNEKQNRSNEIIIRFHEKPTRHTILDKVMGKTRKAHSQSLCVQCDLDLLASNIAFACDMLT